ncbi:MULTISPECIES: hypothetical protein [unclassified Streptomyces]|uniref:hypothetical protein n=1 Tax=unclassified Streptomyces TaxID=2593676 RepID=UPI002E38055B|nr:MULTISPECIES: hypothetical protein [unclassified Streptomyces]WUC68325.1 hypothetical protein OG861_31025 [Streptomyces sp. NBC_00539]
MRGFKTLGAAALAVALVSGVGWAAHASDSQAPAKPKAAPAAASVDGYQLVKLPNTNVPNFERRTVFCPPGKVAIGGGAEAQGEDAVLLGSFPTEDGEGWIGLGRDSIRDNVGISVYAICANR